MYDCDRINEIITIFMFIIDTVQDNEVITIVRILKFTVIDGFGRYI